APPGRVRRNGLFGRSITAAEAPARLKSSAASYASLSLPTICPSTLYVRRQGRAALNCSCGIGAKRLTRYCMIWRCVIDGDGVPRRLEMASLAVQKPIRLTDTKKSLSCLWTDRLSPTRHRLLPTRDRLLPTRNRLLPTGLLRKSLKSRGNWQFARLKLFKTI